MKVFKRCNPLLSLCGLNCRLCPMHLDNYCPGCGGGAGNQPCAIARCSQKNSGIEYCYLCNEYPCEKYNGIDEFDSFITHRNQFRDFKKVKRIGLDAYQAEIKEKLEILKYLLANYNDGRQKSFFCLTVNLLELQDIQTVMQHIATETKSDNLTLKEKAKISANLFQALATNRNIVLKLNKRNRK